ncbi:hypothetical protein B296_00016799 [Ensete ventricosum]|uniref:J domain-containing protein n=1 Tax=Ensete ventricosum TaxID=4639 RepID=A0A426YNC1_ENSVE|nr:hypothetical protein B296_00016799 [Ensete ventricosum]
MRPSRARIAFWFVRSALRSNRIEGSMRSLLPLCLVVLRHAKKLHPDTNKDDADAERKFQEVQRAYKVNPGYVGPNVFEQAASGGDPGGPFDAGYAEDEFSMNDVCRLPSVIFLSAVNALIFMQTGPFRLQTTCSHCGGFGRTVKCSEKCFTELFEEPLQVMQRTKDCERNHVSQAGCDG